MYLFVAYYINLNNDSTRQENFYLDKRFFVDEKSLYMVAMKRAYEKIQDEILDKLEFIGILEED